MATEKRDHQGPESEYQPRKLLLTVTEASEALSLKRSKVYELLASGEIESVKIGRARRIPPEALAKFIQRLRDDAGPADDV